MLIGLCNKTRFDENWFVMILFYSQSPKYYGKFVE